MKKRKGKLIAVEGIDGCGKSSVVKYIEHMFPGECVVFSQPSVITPYGKLVRKSFDRGRRLPFDVEYAALMIDRAFMCEEMDKQLSYGKMVVTDRHYLSMAAYQSYGSDRDFDTIVQTNQMLFGVPDLFIILDLDPRIAAKRIRKRSGKVKSVLDTDLELMRHCAELFKGFDRENVVHIDASKDIVSVCEDVLKIV